MSQADEPVYEPGIAEVQCRYILYSPSQTPSPGAVPFSAASSEQMLSPQHGELLARSICPK